MSIEIAFPRAHPRRLPASGRIGSDLIPRRSRVGRRAMYGWVLFALQLLSIVIFEVANDIVRGNVWRPDAAEAMRHAHAVAHFEAAHGFFAEPALQAFFRQGHSLLGVFLGWSDVVHLANGVYAFCHIFVTLAVAVWIYVAHRTRFPRVRNIAILTNIFALVGYEVYPMAPPRLTIGLMYHGHAVRMEDTMGHVLGTGTLNGTPIGYNPLSAMPSLHVAWAIIVGASLLLMARHPLLRLLGLMYPFVMAFTVVVTANHYVMDAIGAAVIVSLASILVLALEWVLDRRSGTLPIDPGASTDRGAVKLTAALPASLD